MRALYVAMVLALPLALSSCTKPEYWVKGLTLPPGSTVQQKTETDKGSGDAAAGGGKVLQVIFECPGGFDKVSAHFAQVLKAQGYSEVADPMGLGGADVGGLDKFMKSMKGYEKPGKGGYYVVVDSMGVMLGGMNLPNVGGDKLSKMSDTYTLMVMPKK